MIGIPNKIENKMVAIKDQKIFTFKSSNNTFDPSNIIHQMIIDF